MNAHFRLYDKPDGGCALHIEGEGVRHFADLLEAMEFMNTLPERTGGAMTIYDCLGKVVVHSSLE